MGQDNTTRKLLIGWVIGVLMLLGAVFSTPYWAWSTSDYTDDLGQEMPERGDVGWDDAIRTNYKILEVSLVPLLEGHYVVEEPAVSGTTTVIEWGEGWVFINDGTGVSKYLPSGTTTIEASALSWFSAVTASAAANEVTMQVRTGEYDIPNSGGSGFVHVPIAVITTEAGNVVRHKSLSFMAPWKYPVTQPLDSGATPTFQGAVIRDMISASKGNFSSSVTGPSGTSPMSMPSGGLYIDTNDKNLEVGIANHNYAVPLEWTEDVIVFAPDLLDNPHAIPLFTIPSGVTAVVNGVTIFTDTSGVSVAGIVYSATATNLQFGSGTTLFNFCVLSTAGTSVWSRSYTGTSIIPQDRTVMMDFGSTSPGYIRVRFTGRLVGARP